MSIYDIHCEIQAERARQDQQWGGKPHDKMNGLEDWCNYIGHQLHQTDHDNAKERFIKIAALAQAALECME